jgi:hypothetical protein
MKQSNRRVVLFYPSNKFGGAVQPRIELPLSLLAIGTPLDRAGYKVTIIDQRVDQRWRDTLSNELNNKPICVGVSSMTGPQIRNGLDARNQLAIKVGVSSRRFAACCQHGVAPRPGLIHSSQATRQSE